MPPRSRRAVNRPNPGPKVSTGQEFSTRVVTRQNLIPAPCCARPGCHEPPRSTICNPARYCDASCRRAVRRVLDRERKWQSRGTLDGRKKRALEYTAAKVKRQQDRDGMAGQGPPPKRRE